MLRALILKEWRENRWFLLGLILLAPISAIGCREWLTGWGREALVGSSPWVIASLLAVAVLGISGDLLAGGAGSGRLGFLVALPVRPAKIWTAKALFLLLVSSLYLAYLLLLENIFLLAVGAEPRLLFELTALERSLGGVSGSEQFAIVLATGAVALCFGVLVHRGLAVVLATLATVGGLVLLYRELRIERLSEDTAIRLYTASLVGLAFLTGSFVAFTWGRVHLLAPLRRLALAGAGLVLVLAPATAGVGVSVAGFQDLDPADRGVMYSVWVPDPGGEWVVVRAERAERMRFFRPTSPLALWSVNVADGRVRELRHYLQDSRMDNPRLLPLDRGRIEVLEGRLVRTILLETGECVEEREVSRDEARARYRRSWENAYHNLSQGHGWYYRGAFAYECPKRWLLRTPLDATSGVLTQYVRSTGRNRGAVYFSDSGRFLDLEPPPEGWWWFAGLIPENHRGAVLLLSRPREAGQVRVERAPLDGSGASLLFAGRCAGSELSPDGRRGVLFAEGGPWLLSASDASMRRLPVPESSAGRAVWDWDSKRVVLITGHGEWHVTLGDQSIVTRALDLPTLSGWPAYLMGDRILHVVMEDDGCALEVVDLDGTVRRILPTDR